MLMQIPILTKLNYEKWSAKMKMALEAFDVWNLVIRGYEEPQEGANLSEVEQAIVAELLQKDATAKCIIYDRINEDTFEQIMWEPNAKKIWDRLEKFFAKRVENRKEAVTEDDSVKKIEAEYSSVEELKTLDEIIKAEFNLTEYGKVKDATEDDDVGEEPKINLYEEDVESEFDDAFDVVEESEEADVIDDIEVETNDMLIEEEIVLEAKIEEEKFANEEKAVEEKLTEEKATEDKVAHDETEEAYKTKDAIIVAEGITSIQIGNEVKTKIEIELVEKFKSFWKINMTKNLKSAYEKRISAHKPNDNESNDNKEEMKEKVEENFGSENFESAIQEYATKKYTDNMTVKIEDENFVRYEEIKRFTRKHEKKKIGYACCGSIEGQNIIQPMKKISMKEKQV